MLEGCCGVVPGCSELFRGCSGDVPGCSGAVPGLTDTQTFVRQNLKSLRAREREQNMFEWRQEPCQFRNITAKVSLVKRDT